MIHNKKESSAVEIYEVVIFIFNAFHRAGISVGVSARWRNMLYFSILNFRLMILMSHYTWAVVSRESEMGPS
jgi:hypothetical protein